MASTNAATETAASTDTQIEEVRRLGFDRIVFFSDGVLAIALTLLALEIHLPDVDLTSNQAVTDAILGMIPAISAFSLSFFVVAMYWILHHRLFTLIVKYDYRLITLNLLFLFGTAFVPVTTAVLGRYANYPAAGVFYAIGTALVGLFEFALWVYVVRNRHLLRPGLPEKYIRYISIRILIPPLTFLLSIPIAAINANLIEISWALMIPAFLIVRATFPREHQLRDRL